jgi:signal transduction histidine kinase/CheY-like chemotaxis protein/HAMP domain-containing protein
MFKNLTVWRKLLLAFGSLILLFIFSVSITLWRTADIQSHVNQITQVEEPLQTAGLEMEVSLGHAIQALMYHITEPEGNKHLIEMKQAEARYETLASKFDQIMEKKGQGKLLAIISDQYVQYKLLRDNVIKLDAKKQAGLVLFLKQIQALDRIIEDRLVKISPTDPELKQKLEAALSIEVNFHEVASDVFGFLNNTSNYFKEDLEISIKDFAKYEQLYRKTNLNVNERLVIGDVHDSYGRLIEEGKKLMQDQVGLIANLHKLEEQRHEMGVFSDKQIQPLIHGSIKKAIRSVENASFEALIIVLVSSLVVILFALLAVFWLTRQIIRPLGVLKEATEDYIAGNKEVKIALDSADELGTLAQSFRDLIANINQLTQKNEETSWIKTEVARILGLAQGDQNLQSLLQMVIGELAEDIGAGHGVIYLKDKRLDFEKKDSDNEKGNKQTLSLLGSYAYQARKKVSEKIKFGEGLIGQCALEKKAILLTQVPSDYIAINSGLGEQKPLNIIALPLIFEESLLGVIELASFHEFTSIQRDMLEEVSKGVAVSINNVEASEQTKVLLKKSERLSKELQSQQEELKTSNEELEEKTRILKENEEELKAQTEELQAANEELEEKSERLKQQNEDIGQKNKEVEEAREEVEQRAKDLALASKYKSEFLANMSHELRTPLNSLLILSKDLESNKEDNLTEKQIESAKVIHEGGQDLLTLINDILDLSKVEAGKLQIDIAPVDLQEFLAGLKMQFDPIVKDKGLAFDVELSRQIAQSIDTDDQRLSQIIKNLCFNAVKFTEKGGVTIKVSEVPGNLKLENKELITEGAIAFCVIDTGIGIAKEKQREIFEAFQQGDGSTNRNYGGTGLGLAISRAMSELLGGELTLESEEGKGSMFVLVLPTQVKSAKLEQEEKPVLPVDGANADKTPSPAVVADAEIKAFLPDDRDEIKAEDKSILIIEDDATFAQLLMDTAREKGYLCLSAGDGHSGFSLAKKYQPNAIILDLGLPDVDGLQILDQLKFELSTRHIPIHIVSAREETPEPKQKGAIGYLLKPASSEGLTSAFQKIESVLSSKVKKILVVEDDPKGQIAIESLIDNDSITLEQALTGKEAKEKIMSNHYDCVILDLTLPDFSGFELLKQLKKEKVSVPPVVVYTGRELSEEEHKELQCFTSGIVLKGAESPERLLDEISLFLHSVESELPKKQKKMIQMLHNAEKLLSGRKVLLVDDDVRNVFALSSALEGYGLDVIVASNGQVALDKLDNEVGIELVIMDIMMPIMDGYEAMRKIRKNKDYKDLPVIALTAKAMQGDRKKCLDAGASDYITKPVDMEKLLSMMKVWLFK